MKSRNATLSLILILLVLGIALFRRWQEPRAEELFDRTPPRLQYTRHAQCRMKCRFISKKEIDEVIKKGVINLSKSDRNDQPCPTYAMQGRTSDGQYIRVIFAQCESVTKVITCYDLETDFTCHCPGDESKQN